jgi:SAM-dependent methyltransferase
MNPPGEVAHRLRGIVAACAAGDMPPNVALMHLHMSASTRYAASAAIEAALRSIGTADAGARQRIERLAALDSEHPEAWSVVRETLDRLSHSGGPQPVEEIARRFDAACAATRDAAVAAYALGDAGLLACATAEIVERLREWGLVGRASAILDLGCGTGRVTSALAGEAAFVAGADISRAMLAVARERCDTANVAFVATAGRDLGAFRDAAFDLVLAVDSFPYIIAAELDLAARHVRDAARVLRPGGALLILNFSYRGDIEQDRADVARLASDAGLELLRNGERAFSFWDGSAFHLGKW